MVNVIILLNILLHVRYLIVSIFSASTNTAIIVLEFIDLFVELVLIAKKKEWDPKDCKIEEAHGLP